MSLAPEPDALDVRAAAELVARARQQADHELGVRLRPTFLAWGVAWLVGFGSLWLSVRGQRPYAGPSALAFVVLGVLDAAAVLVSVATIRRSTRGVHGASERQGMLFGLSWPVGFALVFALIGALGVHGASAVVTGIAGAAAAPTLVAIIYLVGSAIWRSTVMFVLGAWLALALVTVAGGYAGPVWILALEAIGGGGGFFVAAWLRPRR